MTHIPIPAELSGIRSHEIPCLTLPADYNLTDHPFPPRRQIVGNLYSIPDQPEFLVRRQGLSVRQFPDRAAVLDLIAVGIDHFNVLAKDGLHVPSHRHIEARLPDPAAEREGRVLSVLRHLKGLVRLRPSSPEHTAATLHVVQGLTTYTAQVVEGSLPGIMWDIYRAEQYSLQEPQDEVRPTPQPWAYTPQGVFLHDFGLSTTDIKDGCGLSFLFNLSLCRLATMAATMHENAQGTSHEADATNMLSVIQKELPPPEYDRKQ